LRSSRLKTKHVAQVSVQNFIWRHPATYYWTFTVHENLEDKTEALRRAKPLFDLIARRVGLTRCGANPVRKTQGEYLAFWELQERGSWHLHLLTSVYLDVKWLRPWMVSRGWGQQMYVELVSVANSFTRSGSGNQCFGPHTSGGGAKLARYLTKYLTKSLDDVKYKKPFSGSHAAKAGTVGFCWESGVNPYAYFFYYGRRLFFDLYQRIPCFKDYRHCMRLGYEACDWVSLDPWTEPP
jgi:hypothetical protein